MPENNGITPLMDAASGGSLELVKLLLEHGADPSLRDNFGDSAEVYARKQGFPKVVELLRQVGEQRNGSEKSRKRK